ncbi:hypothetical protein AB6A40_004440 [Gnathostoma spinigerum]|uniref:Uncharacterized protein n=1 Tax=Gnathostoma spinigerum TaxID=75299 RepID=A0ABD6EET9_9BILA
MRTRNGILIGFMIFIVCHNYGSSGAVEGWPYNSVQSILSGGLPSPHAILWQKKMSDFRENDHKLALRSMASFKNCYFSPVQCILLENR